MKIVVLLFAFYLFAGCSYGTEKIKQYVDDPKSLLEDPLSVSHQQAMDDLESSYLRKKITYAEYLEKKKELEEDYTREVQKREN